MAKMVVKTKFDAKDVAAAAAAAALANQTARAHRAPTGIGEQKFE